MNKGNMDLVKNKSESQDIYQTLCNSESMFQKLFKLECDSIRNCLRNTLGVLLTDEIFLNTGSTAEGTDITAKDHDKCVHSATPCYISDKDTMHVWCEVRVIDEGHTLREMFDNYMYCQAERGKHTTDGFRKLWIIHSPGEYSLRQFRLDDWVYIIIKSVEQGYISSSKFLAAAASDTICSVTKLQSVNTGLGTKGPSQIIQGDGFVADLVRCFYVKNWPKEAESWFTRQTHWPDRKLKTQIKKVGYLLVPTGNSNSQESDLEWRCSFSIAEQMLFQSLTTFQRCTFIMLKALLKEYLPSDINTDCEKQLLSTYHIKTLFLWCLEDSNLKWEPENMLDIIYNLFHKLLSWIKQQYFPHYFIPSVNLLDSRWLQGRGKSLIDLISAIKNDLSNNIRQSHFIMGHKMNPSPPDRGILFFIYIHPYVVQYVIGILQTSMQKKVFDKVYFLRQTNCSHSDLIEGLISVKPDVDPQMRHLYRAIYSDPVHDKLLTETVPGLIAQYHGCIHLARYCMAARDGRVLPGVLHTAESLLKDTLHLDPCSGFVKLACLYIATWDFDKAMDRLNAAESNFLCSNMLPSAPSYVQFNKVGVLD